MNVGSYEYSECRLLGHSWHVVPSDWDPRYGLPMTTRCERCNIERRDEINRNTGEVEARRYQYPTGYLFERDTDDEQLPRRTDFRRDWLDRQLEAHSGRRTKRSSKAGAA